MAELSLEQKRAIAMANARLRLQSPKPSPNIESPTSFGNLVGAAVEPNLALGTGAIAGPIAGLAGIAGTVLPGPEGQGADWVNKVSNALSYRPHTEGGKNAMSAIAYPLEKFSEASDWAGGKATDITGSPLVGTGVKTAINALPLLIPTKYAPKSGNVGKVVGGTAETASDLGALVGSAVGNKTGVNRLAANTVERVLGQDRPSVIQALKNPTEYVPGAKPNVGQAITEANIGKPSQFGGGLVRLQKDLSGAAGIEDVLPSNLKAQQAALAKHLEDLKATTKPMRMKALEDANAGYWTGKPLDTNSIISGIDSILEKPGLRSSDVVQMSLGAIKDKINELPKPGGVVDARDLYTVRKEIGNTVERFGKETANWDKRLASSIEREVQKHIDAAIENAGGTGWKDYLKTYSEGMKGIESHLARDAEMKKIAASVKGSQASIANSGIPNAPHILTRPMVIANYLLKLFTHGAETPVEARLAELMKDPKELAKFLESREVNPQIAENAKRAAMAAALTQESR